MSTRRFLVVMAALITVGIAGAGTAEAQLTKRDFQTVGDGLLVKDDATGLEWLTPVYTKGRSYNDIVAGWGDLLTIHGFRIGHPTQVRSLIQHNFGNPPTVSPGTADGYLSALEFFDVFGIAEHVFCPGTTPPGPCPRTQGWTYSAFFGVRLTSLGMITIGDTYGYMIDYTRSLDYFYANLRSEQLGFWLYREAQNTDTGSGVVVSPEATLPDGSTGTVSMTFDNVIAGGETTVTTDSQGQPPPSGFKLTTPPVYYEISTTAEFSGDVRVCLSWTEGQIANEANVSMFHYEGGAWVDITDPESRDTVNNTVCGTATSLSPFTLFEVKYAFGAFLPPIDSEPTANSARAGSSIPIKFSLGGDRGLDIFADGYPRAQLMQCVTGAPIDEVEETVTAGTSGLTYDPDSDQYTYIWKTDATWRLSCRQLQLRFNDGETYTARFTFGR